LGLAFILKILNQNQQFDSLHWFESVQKHYIEKQTELKTEISKSKLQKTKSQKENNPDVVNDEDNSMKLTLNKVDSYLMEYELLFFSFESSRIFFKD
jgi:WASH complex subunit 7